MENKDLLDDDLDWDAEINNWTEEPDETDEKPTPVTMLQTFSTEQEADVAAAILQGEGIVCRVVASITGPMTPFAYGNVRLFVPSSQLEAATKILLKITGKDVANNRPQPTSTQILTIVLVGLFIIGLIIRLLQKAFDAL
jgi:ABC-type molybdate transport system ATPase subunit